MITLILAAFIVVCGLYVYLAQKFTDPNA